MCKNRLRVWGLYTDEGRVAACETIERPALVQAKNGEVKSTSSFSIGAVFTPKEHRGKGYASVMMKQMASGVPFKPALSDEEIIKATGVKTVDQSLRFTPLWSDVGVFYEKFGWKGTTDYQYEVNIAEGHVPETNGTSPVKYLNESDIYKLGDLETANFISDFEKFPYKGDYKCGIVPDHTLYEWHFARAKYLAKFAKAPVPTVFGAQVGDSWMAWHHMYNAKELAVLRVKLAKAEDLKVLIDAAKKHVKEAGFSMIDKVVVWQQEREWNDVVGCVKQNEFEKEMEELGAKYEHRGSSIPCVMFVEGDIQGCACEFVDHGKLTWT